jgi:hypothetical protein
MLTLCSSISTTLYEGGIVPRTRMVDTVPE